MWSSYMSFDDEWRKHEKKHHMTIGCMLPTLFLLFSVAMAAEIALTPPITVGPRVRVTWDAPTDSVRVLGYHVAAAVGSDSVTAGADSADTSAVLDVSPILPDSAITRVLFVVRAYNTAGMSAPSDTVSLPMSAVTRLFGDLNHDGAVDVLDSAILWSRGIVGTVRGMPGYSSEMDIDADGDVDVRDHLYFVYNMGTVTN
jgi:hypothetical protein